MLLRDAPEGECGNDTNARNLSLKILYLGYYWPTLMHDAIDYIRRCDSSRSWPFMKWGMDIVGKMPPAPGKKFGVSSEIVCDNGSQFISDKTEEFCKRWNINLIKSTPRYPQADGQAESNNKIIINNLKRRLTSCKGKWAEELPWMLWSDMTNPKTSMGQMPYSLVYSTEALLPT
ncbi:uncharacterized protein LOC141707737 [Apium graveolens]|uniref:uncharacterized protein LOC141707737 n=1 Tax=Apium graveolens TaxID=4045 RepID=UPI003D7B52E9